MGAPIPHWSGLAEDTDPANLRDNRGAWDKCLFDGAALPGIAEVEVQAGRKIDSRGAPGRNGSRLVDKGAEAAKVTIKLRLWTYAQLQALSGQFPSLSYREERAVVRRSADEIRREAEAFAEASSALPSIGFAQTRTVTRRSRAPVAVSHPACALVGITFVYVERVRVGTPKNGELEITFECLEWTPPARRALGTAAPAPRAQGIGNIAVTRPFQAPPPSSGP
jgi:hypothetical protein